MLGGMTDLPPVPRAPAPAGRRSGFRRTAGRPDGQAPGRLSAPRALLAIVLTGQFMAVLDASVVNVAAPAIHAELHASGAGLQLVIAGYVITYAVLLVTGARLGDIVGHRRMFLAGRALFPLASLGLRPGPLHRHADRPSVHPGGGRRGHDPAGAEPDPAHVHRDLPGRGDAAVR